MESDLDSLVESVLNIEEPYIVEGVRSQIHVPEILVKNVDFWFGCGP